MNTGPTEQRLGADKCAACVSPHDSILNYAADRFGLEVTWWLPYAMTSWSAIHIIDLDTMASFWNWHTIISCQTNMQSSSLIQQYILITNLLQTRCRTGYFVPPASLVLELIRFRCNLSWWTHTSGDVWILHYHPRGRRDVNSIRIGAISWGCNCYRINNTIRTLRKFEVNLLAINKVDIREDARCTTRHNHSLHNIRFVYNRIIPYMKPNLEANPSGEGTSRNSTVLFI